MRCRLPIDPYRVPIVTAKCGTGPRRSQISMANAMLAQSGPSRSYRHYSHDPSSPGTEASTSYIVFEPYVTDHGSIHAMQQLCRGCEMTRGRRWVGTHGSRFANRGRRTRMIGSDVIDAISDEAPSAYGGGVKRAEVHTGPTCHRPTARPPPRRFPFLLPGHAGVGLA